MATTSDRVALGRSPADAGQAEIFRHLDVWAERGLITREEAEAIREFEGVSGEIAPKRIAPIIQALLYMGTALTLAALGTIYWRLYEDLSRFGRVIIPALLALALATGGWFTARRNDPDIRRFGGVLWLLSTGGFAGFMSEMVMPNEVAGDWSLFLVGAGAAAWAGIFATLSPQATTQIGLFGTTMAAVVGVPFALTGGFDHEPSIAWLGLALGLLGVVWLLGGQSRALRPTALAHVLGGALVLYAPTFLFGTEISEGIPLLLGSVLAGALLGASTWLRSPALLAVGAVGLYAYSFRAIWVYFGDTIGMPVVLLIGGLLLLTIALGALRLGSRRHG